MTEDLPLLALLGPQAASQMIALQEEIIALRQQIEDASEMTALERAYDRRRIAALETAQQAPQPAQKDRGEVLVALIASRGGKMPQADARRIMRLSKPRFSELLRTMKDRIEVRPSLLNKRNNILILK